MAGVEHAASCAVPAIVRVVLVIREFLRDRGGSVGGEAFHDRDGGHGHQGHVAEDSAAGERGGLSCGLCFAEMVPGRGPTKRGHGDVFCRVSEFVLWKVGAASRLCANVSRLI
jgi:hypothetical protein